MATHGSLTKAGKVRGQTPKVEGRKIVGTNSKLRNKSNFRKRFVLATLGHGGKMPGQINKLESSYVFFVLHLLCFDPAFFHHVLM